MESNLSEQKEFLQSNQAYLCHRQVLLWYVSAIIADLPLLIDQGATKPWEPFSARLHTTC
jgi:hypothetical protein